MGERSRQLRLKTQRNIRKTPLTEAEREMLANAVYEGSAYHKRSPGDFDLPEPPRPRRDKTLCDEAGIVTRAHALRLFCLGKRRGVVSHAQTLGFPNQFWAVDDDGTVFEAMHGGSTDNAYHGYPIRDADPLAQEVRKEWNRHDDI